MDGLRYVISKEMKLQDSERPGSTRKEYFLLLKTSVDNYNDLLSKSAGGDCARPTLEDRNTGHKYILAARMKELSASIVGCKSLLCEISLQLLSAGCGG